MADHESPFRRANLFELEMSSTTAHGGVGAIDFCRIVESSDVLGACNFIDFTRMPVGTSIGEHQHLKTEEEYYLLIKGEGLMCVEGEEFTVKAGDLIRNPPGGTHSLKNTGSSELQLFVFEVQVR